MIHLGENGAGIAEQGPAGVGEADAARQAVEQLRVELALKRLDLLAERRLADANLGRRPREMPLLGDSQKISDVA